METVSVTTTPNFSVGNGAIVPTGALMFGQIPSKRNYDIAPDGKRFVSVVAAGQIESAVTNPRIHVVLNWTEELKQRVPTK